MFGYGERTYSNGLMVCNINLEKVEWQASNGKRTFGVRIEIERRLEAKNELNSETLGEDYRTDALFS